MPPPSLRLGDSLLVRHVFDGLLHGHPSPFVPVQGGVLFRYAHQGEQATGRTGRTAFGVGLVATAPPYDLDLHPLPFALPDAFSVPSRARTLDVMHVHENRLLLSLLDPRQKERSKLWLLAFDVSRRRWELIERAEAAPGYRVVRALEEDDEPDGESLDATRIGVREENGKFLFEPDRARVPAPGELIASATVVATGSLRLQLPTRERTGPTDELMTLDGFNADLKSLSIGDRSELVAGAGALAVPEMLAVGGRVFDGDVARSVLYLLRSPPLFKVSGETIGGPPEYFSVDASDLLGRFHFHGEGTLSYSFGIPSTFDMEEAWQDGSRISDTDYSALVAAIGWFFDWMFSGHWQMRTRAGVIDGVP